MVEQLNIPLSENTKFIIGTGIALVPIIIGIYKYIKNKGKDSSTSNDNNNTLTVNNYLNTNSNENDNPNNSTKILTKDNTRILFIDDEHSEYKIVSILRKAGWIHTKGIKDVKDLDSTFVKESDIIFVDINGVGEELFEDQGLGLASALKKKYSEKRIVIYSAETTGDRFHEALRLVDHCLPKNADAYQFINLIENLIANND
ncbi:response regulator [Myroides phaeus]|uniref:response regulator n=1 Tax=Myroides phaeus TaxID=702745 RepID=UPI00130331AF|nr:response regulator [Myroides phaeus]